MVLVGSHHDALGVSLDVSVVACEKVTNGEIHTVTAVALPFGMLGLDSQTTTIGEIEVIPVETVTVPRTVATTAAATASTTANLAAASSCVGMHSAASFGMSSTL